MHQAANRAGSEASSNTATSRIVPSRTESGDHGTVESAPIRFDVPKAHLKSGVAPPSSPVRPWHRYLMGRVLSIVGKPPLAAVLWDGKPIAASDQLPLATVVVHNAATLRRIVVNPFYQLAEAYANGQIDVIGDLVETIAAINRSIHSSAKAGFLYKLVSHWLRLPRFHSLAASRDNVYHHYDIGNDFYRLWLDEQLAYTCAYFPSPEVSLEGAQVAKFDHV